MLAAKGKAEEKKEGRTRQGVDAHEEGWPKLDLNFYDGSIHNFAQAVRYLFKVCGLETDAGDAGGLACKS